MSRETCLTRGPRRRVKLARIAAAGLDCANSARQSMAEAEARLLSGLTETERDILLALLKNALPAMTVMLTVLICDLADTVFIGQTHNDILVAALSLATPVFLIFMAVGAAFGIGGTSVISRALSKGRPEYAKKVCSFCMWSCVAVSVALSAAFLLLTDQILTLIGASSDTWEPAKTYLLIVAMSGPFVLNSGCYSNIVCFEGQPTKTMIGRLVGNLLNIVLDPF